MYVYVTHHSRALSDLEVADVNYRQSRLGVAMMGVASRLRTLAMDHVYGWDTTDLRAVGQYCSQLGLSDALSILTEASFFQSLSRSQIVP